MLKQFSILLVTICIQFVFVGMVFAVPTAELVQKLNTQVLRVQVKHNNGKIGLGSAVVIAQNQVVTNCHVVTDARHVEVVMNGITHVVTELRPDWQHDLCVLTVANLDAPIAKIGTTKNLNYETSVFTVGFPDKTTSPVNTYGVVNGLFPIDDGIVIRATSAFKPGASGGGIFDDAGDLVGIITLKSKGYQPHYYYMPVEWVQALMKKPAQALGEKNEKPFWAAEGKQRPYFMQVVKPTTLNDWQTLLNISTDWVNAEPNSAESWFYLAVAEYQIKSNDKAAEHFRKALALNQNHCQAIEYLNKINEQSANTKVALN